MALVEDVLRVASREVGYQEKPPYSNNTKYGLEYGSNGYPWCVTFLWWVFRHSGEPFPIRTAYAPALLSAYRRLNQFCLSGPQIGDIVFFAFNNKEKTPDHCGIVKDVGRTGLLTIEGNTSLTNQRNGGSVMVRTREFIGNYITGYGRPEYKQMVTPLFNPPHKLEPIVAELNCPTGGCWLLSESGAIYSYGGAPYKGGANGQGYFAGRHGAQLQLPNDEERQAGHSYVIVATSGERYRY